MASNAASLRRAVFLDRDGVLNRSVIQAGKPYPPQTLEEFSVLPSVGEALAILRGLDFHLYVVTNQPDVARGTQRRSVVEAMHDRLRTLFPLDGFYVCYHDDNDACDCRKPKPGLLFRAALEHNISLHRSYMIGDRWRDIDCGHAAQCTTLFVDRDYAEDLRQQPCYKAADLLTAAELILSLERPKP